MAVSEPSSVQEQELARLRAELAATQQQLAAAQAALGDFAYTVSHDLRANLRHITAYGGLVREELGAAAGAEVASYLDIVTNAARLMGRQIDGLMAWSQLDRAELHAAALDLPELIGEARRLLAAELAGRAIEWRIAADLPAVRGDAVLLRQLLLHLLSNAVKFTRRSEAAVVEIGGQPAGAEDGAAGGWCELYVRDNGVGFDPLWQHRLFHVFQRLHPAGEFEGLGLGLALAGKIVARHGGRIRAEGTLGAGCCVRFTLPSAQ